jgi:hypothetical protein
MSCTLVHVYRLWDETTACIMKVMSWSHVINSMKPAILWPFSEEPQFSLASFNFRSIKFDYQNQSHYTYISSYTSNYRRFLSSFSNSKTLINFHLPTVHAKRPTCYILLDSVMRIKFPVNLKYTISLYTLSGVSLSWHRQHNGGVSADSAIASLSLLHTCIDSGVHNSQFCYMYILKRTYSGHVYKTLKCESYI